MTDAPLSEAKNTKKDASTLLSRAKTGDKAALRTLLARERSLLYDYLMRMTGQMQRSLDTVEEVFLTVDVRVLQDVDDVRQLRAKLIKTVRKFSLDIWNAATPLLENAAFSKTAHTSPREGKDSAPTQPTQQQIFDRAFRALPGGEREVLWLTWNLQWDEATIAEVTFRTRAEVQTLQTQGLAAIRSEAPSLAGLDLAAFGGLQVPHPVEVVKSGVTQELSRVMRGIQERPQNRSLTRKLILLGIVLGILALGLTGRETIESWFKQILSEKPHQRSHSP